MNNNKINVLNKIKTKELEKVYKERNYLELNDTCLFTP